MKRSVVVLFVLLLAVGSIPIRAAAQYLVWHYDRLIENNTGMNGNAPDIAISGLKAVAVWYQSVGYNRRLYANYSIDGGKTWHADQIIEDVNSQAYSPHVVLSGNIAVVAWNQYYGGAYRIYTNYSADGGATWHKAQIIEDLSGGHALGDGPAIAISGSRVVVVWSQNDGSHFRVYVNYSSDGGRTWHSRQALDGVTAYDSGLPSVAVSGANAVTVWARSDGTRQRLYSNSSSDGGATWQGERPAGFDANYWVFTSRVVLSGSNAVAVCYQNTSLGATVYANNSSNGGAAWGSPQILKNPVTSSAAYPDAAMSGTRVVAVWLQEEVSTTGRAIWSNYSTDGGATWHGAQSIMPVSTYAPGNPRIALSGLYAVAVWRQPDGVTQHIFTNYSTDGGATWHVWHRIDGAVGVPSSTGVPGIALSGMKAAAVWVENNGVSDRIVSNYAGSSAAETTYLWPPKLSSPANGATNIPRTATLYWEDTNTEPQELKYQIRIKPAGGTYTIYSVTANSTAFIKSGLVRGQTYYWNARAIGNGKDLANSTWANNGANWKFTVQR